jgi:hypothetical protein
MSSQDIERMAIIVSDPAPQGGAVKDGFTISERQAQ